MCLDYLSQLRPKVFNVYMNREEMHANVPFEDRQKKTLITCTAL